MNKTKTNQGCHADQACACNSIPVGTFSKLFLALIALIATFVLAPTAQAQTARFRTTQNRVTIPLNFSGVYRFTNLVTVSGLSAPADLTVGGLPITGVTVSITDTNGNALPLDGGLPSTLITTNLLITMALTNVAEGLYPLSLNAANGAINNWNFDLQVASFWSGSGLTGNTNWSSTANWASGSLPTSADDVFFGQTGATNAVITNSIVDQNFTVASLRFGATNSSVKFHTLNVNSGVTIGVGGSKGLSVLRDFETELGGAAGGMTVTITGIGGTVAVTNESANISILLDSQQAHAFDMTQLGNFVADVSQIDLGDYYLWPNYRNHNDQNAYGGIPRRFLPTVSFARTNVIKAVYVDPNNYTNADSRHFSLSFLNSELTGTSTQPAINLGISNYFAIDSVNFVGGQSQGLLRFNSAFTASNPIAIFRGVNGGRMSVFSVSDNGGTNTANSNVKAFIDFSGNNGNIDVLVDRLYISRDRRLIASAGTPNIQGSLGIGKGIVDVNTAVLGFQEYGNHTNTAVNWLGYCQGFLQVTNNGIFKVNRNLTLGYTSEANANGQPFNTRGVILVASNSTLVASNIIVDGGLNRSAGNVISLTNNGNLIISNSIAGPAKALDTLNVANGSTLTLHINGALNTPYVYLTNFNNVGSNFLKIASIKNLGSITSNLKLISFAANNGTFQVLGMPAGLSGALITTNNDGIYLSVLTGTPKNLVWRGYQNSNWDLTSANWLDQATGLHTNFNNGDVVAFDDAIVPTTISLATPTDIIPGGINMTNTLNSYVIDSGAGGDIQGSGVLNKYGTGTLEIAGATTLLVAVNQGTLIGSGSIGSAVIASGASMNFSGNLGSLTSAGVSTLSNAAIGAGILTVQGTGTVTNNGTYTGSFSVLSGGVFNNTGTMHNIGSSGVSGTMVNSGPVGDDGLFNSILSVNNGGVFKDLGVGSLTLESLVINPGGTFIPGGDGIGTTTVLTTHDGTANSNPGLIRMLTGSTNIFKVDLSAVPPYTRVLAKRHIFGPSQSNKSINGATIQINNIGAPFSAPAVLNLFGNSGGGSVIGDGGLNTTNSYPIMSPLSPASGLAWDVLSDLFPNGNINIIGVATNPTNITSAFTVSPSNIVTELSWPSDHIGWRLQQLNTTLDVGITATNWVAIFGASVTNDIVITNNITTNSAVFYRLIYP